MRRRIWDWIVGVTMIVVALFAGGVVAALIAMPVTVGVAHVFGLDDKKSDWAGVGSWVFTFALLQAAGLYDYYRRRTINTATGNAGLFHLIPRAIQRMRTGQEAVGFIDAGTGQPANLQAPINAAARGLSGLVLFVASVAAVIYCALGKGAWTLVVTAAGFLGAIIGLVIILQACFAYAGFIARK